jgi:hypothetical protein
MSDMKFRPLFQETLLVFMQALGLAPMKPVPVRVENRYDLITYSRRRGV